MFAGAALPDVLGRAGSRRGAQGCWRNAVASVIVNGRRGFQKPRRLHQDAVDRWWVDAAKGFGQRSCAYRRALCVNRSQPAGACGYILCHAAVRKIRRNSIPQRCPKNCRMSWAESRPATNGDGLVPTRGALRHFAEDRPPPRILWPPCAISGPRLSTPKRWEDHQPLNPHAPLMGTA